MLKNIIVICSLLMIVKICFGQPSSEAQTDSGTVKKESLLALPIIYYTPETRFAAGAAGLFAFRFVNDSAKNQLSNLQIGAVYTQEKQLLLYLPFRIYYGNNKYLSYGELGYYRYSYFFFGIGNDDPRSEGELYDVNFPRVRLNFLKLMAPHFHLGAYYGLDDFVIKNTQEGGLLENKNLTIPGATGGRVSSLGLIAVYDSRNFQFFPNKGVFFEGSLQQAGSFIGSEFTYTRFYLDLKGYVQTFGEHVLALNGYTESIWGEAPFTSLALLGGNKRLRGYYEGLYRDKKLLLVQAEYRIPIIWRFKLAFFASLGAVAPTWDAFSTESLHHSSGLGIRFLLNKEEKIHVRLDYGIGEQGNSGVYLTVGEAF